MEIHEFNPIEQSQGRSIVNMERKNVQRNNPMIDRNFKCEICGEYLKSSRTLQDHIKQKHRPETHSHFCDYCEWSTFEAARLKSHYLNLHAEKKFKCGQCTYKTAKKAVLLLQKKKRHLRKPRNEKLKPTF